ncbi:2-amino-4-hydroxy-6-hydroxymethyldihydropteridine diphosphokinase [Paracoccus pantotrophus]|uniref:2-amino-4-hydroxy-6- hydroxymethyldihydropteridine diphosphokinase n=1 Tax=Paracoccus pantotrophus TaxID=82367 RepID=UPI000E097CF7|nr:2-amino-4-hydroxy-6-hydroxymethyldihydropteridine diphosphokinase [Paracoccus pantotrophus]RDD96600.1 2-amino-4-hydroxy-6-hydroxymethyldihydropteridine diphosphokinase [Paracoccus pantotrophus]WGR65276.1 2-amino-4-hydroxy-6-hydroxymethyldihydropteridine diphosphokinase [Paracoccus pantotrophus]
MSRNPSQKANLALVALGANLPSSAGSPPESLRFALKKLSQLPQVVPVAFSRFWFTPAFPAGSGPEYVNAAASFRCTLPPEQLLRELHEIEAELGRRRDGGRWQSRGLDLDLLAHGDLVLPDAAVQDHWRRLPPQDQALRAPPHLILPHPRMQDRGFVLALLAEIAPNWVHPRLGLSVAQMLAALPPQALAGMRPASA